MSNQNNDNSGMAIAFAFVATAAFFMVALIFAIAAFAAVVFTFVALWAWDRPRSIFGQAIYPHEARAFVYRGLIGMVLAPIFVIFCAAMFKLHIVDEAWVYIIIGGYTAGSVGIEYLKAQYEQDAAANATYIPPAPPAALPQPKETVRPEPRKSFTFGDWDDEERPR
jgi:hypothetical protein